MEAEEEEQEGEAADKRRRRRRRRREEREEDKEEEAEEEEETEEEQEKEKEEEKEQEEGKETEEEKEMPPKRRAAGEDRQGRKKAVRTAAEMPRSTIKSPKRASLVIAVKASFWPHFLRSYAAAMMRAVATRFATARKQCVQKR